MKDRSCTERGLVKVGPGGVLGPYEALSTAVGVNGSTSKMWPVGCGFDLFGRLFLSLPARPASCRVAHGAVRVECVKQDKMRFRAGALIN